MESSVFPVSHSQTQFQNDDSRFHFNCKSFHSTRSTTYFSRSEGLNHEESLISYRKIFIQQHPLESEPLNCIECITMIVLMCDADSLPWIKLQCRADDRPTYKSASSKNADARGCLARGNGLALRVHYKYTEIRVAERSSMNAC